VPPEIPQELATPVLWLFGAIVVLTLVGILFRTVTFCRRSARECRISWRREGCGGREHPNQDLSHGKLVPPSLEAAKEILSLPPGSMEPEPADELTGGEVTARKLPSSGTADGERDPDTPYRFERERAREVERVRDDTREV
jgi:hypothetical protein